MVIALLFSLGFISLVITLFYGIKFKWFRYRMTFPSIEQENIVSTRSASEIRENCSTGVYRKSLMEDSLVKTDNELQTANGQKDKLNKSYHKSIFRLPFRNKMQFSNNSSKDETDGLTGTIESHSRKTKKKEKDSSASKKNEGIRKSILDRLNSFNSSSSPDLIKTDDAAITKQDRQADSQIEKNLKVLLDESSQYQMVNEVQEMTPAIPARANKKRLNESISKLEKSKVNDIVENDNDLNENKLPTRKPPTPTRRRITLNSQFDSKEKNQELLIHKPPVIKPRKKNINYSIENDENESSFEKEQESVTKINLKSILKTQQSNSSIETKSNVHFVNVSDSSLEYESDENYDIWQKIDFHRDQLVKYYKSEIPPALPKTPPPSEDSHQRNFEFA